MGLLDFVKKLEPDKKKSPFLHTLYDGFFTFLYSPKDVAKNGVHIHDGVDLKRTMVMVVIALQLCYIFGTYNIGHQHFSALHPDMSLFDGFLPKLIYGIVQLIPIFIVTHLVGLGIEFWYAAKKGHGIEEGFLVSGALIPLIMPPDIPMWMLALAVAFAVIIGKEAFGGTGMNILNVALLARVFVFFAYPTTISGDEVWVSGLMKSDAGIWVAQYSWAHTMFNGMFESMGTYTYEAGRAVIDSFTGATPLALAAKGGWEAVTEVYSTSAMWWGDIPGSIGETCKPFVLVGAAMLIFIGIASWRVMFSMFLGAMVMAMLLNMWGATPFMEVPWQYHFYMGSFFFAMAFMATDPVTAASTDTGKWIYGFLIGAIGMIIRVLNPAYPEGWMLAILLLNVFAPLIDHFVLESNISKRLKRATSAQ